MGSEFQKSVVGEVAGGDELFQPHLEKGSANKGDGDWCVCEEGEHF